MSISNPLPKILGSVKDHLKSDFLRKVIETYFSQIFTLSISLVSVILFSRILGPNSRGVLATATAICALGVQFGNIGLHSSNTYFVAKDRSLLGVIIGNTCIVSLVLGSSISLFIWGCHLINPEWIPINGLILVLTVLLIPFTLASLLFQNILLGLLEVRIYNIIEVSVRVFIFVLVCALFYFEIRNAETILLVNLTAIFFGLYFTFRKLKGSLQQKVTFSRQFFKTSLAYGMRSYLAAFFSFLVIRIDLLMVKSILGFEEAGYYSIAMSIADVFSICPVIIGTLLFPRIVSITNEDQRLKIAKKAALGVLITMSLLGLCCIGCTKPIILALLGETFLPAVPAFLWLLPGLILLGVNVIFMNYLASIGLPWITLFSPGIATVFNIILNLKMIPHLGIIGASISSTVCYALMLTMSLLYIRFKNPKPELDTKQAI